MRGCEVAMTRRWVVVLLLGLLVGNAFARFVAAVDPVTAAEAALAAGKPGEALKHYEAALETAVNLPAALRFNAGLAAERAGNVERARELWRAAARDADGATAGRVQYNLGTLDYQAALAALAAGDLEAAGTRLGDARTSLRAAIGLAPELDDARANLELAYQLERLIEQQRAQREQQQQQQGQESQQQQEQGDSGSDSAGGQRQDAAASEDADGGEARDSGAEGAADSEGQGSDPSSAAEQATGDQPAGGEVGDATPADVEPGEGDGELAPTPATVDGVALAPDAPLTADQIRLILQRVRDRDRARRAQLRARAEAQVESAPVERDW